MAVSRNGSESVAGMLQEMRWLDMAKTCEGTYLRSTGPEKLVRFTELMKDKLVANEHKGGWEDISPWDLIGRLRGELEELESALHLYSQTRMTRNNKHVASVATEAADVANFAMMIADVVGGLGGK